MSYSEDFMQGQRDCREGKVHQGGMSPAYDDGFETQYIAEQLLADMGLRQEKEMGMYQ